MDGHALTVNIRWGYIVLFRKGAHGANHLANLANYREGDGLASLVPSGHARILVY